MLPLLTMLLLLKMQCLCIKLFRHLLCALFSIIFVAHAVAAETVLTVGDSITSGLKLNASRTVWECPPDGVITSSYYVCDGEDAENRGGYQPSTRTKIAALGVTADLYNWGFAGEGTRSILNRVSQAMNARAADYVFIMAGTNDLGTVSRGTIVRNLQYMIDAVCESGLTPVVGTITPRFDGASYNFSIQKINEELREYAESLNVPVAENYDALIGNFGAYHSGDYLHINDAGDEVMATQWANAFQTSGGACGRGIPAVTPIMQLLLLDE